MSDNYVMAVDPGKMTGVALFLVTDDAPKLIEAAELGRDEFEKWLEDTFSALQGNKVEVAIERFVISDLDAPWSLQLIGVTSYLSRKNGFNEPVLQKPADAKNFATNERLRNLGYWFQGGAGHANDAIRHGVLYMVKKKLLKGKQLLV